MKTILILSLICSLFAESCTKKEDVQCICHDNNGKMNSYDMGIQNNPSLSVNAAKCDTFGAHNSLDSCNLLVMGN